MSKLAGFLVPQRNKIYFFYGDRYARYDCDADGVEAGYPKPIAGNWNGAFDRDVQAAALRPAGDYAYLFRGAEYVKIDIVGNSLVEGYPKSIADYWPGLFTQDIDAALPALDSNYTYFFKGSEYVKYDWSADTVLDGYPRSIAGNWDGVYASGIDTAVAWPNGNVYFFAGSDYVRYDLNVNAPGEGYPRSIDGNWTGLNLLTGTATTPTPSAGEKPIAVENPGGGRVTNKNDPAPSDLVTMDGPNNAKVQLHNLAAKFWGLLIDAARAEGHASPLLLPVSGYRSSATQKVLFDQAVARYGSEEEARKWVAKPGGSAHQSGRAVDCWLGTSNDSGNVGTQRKTAVWAWLVANAERFGFYPYEAEPWHWEYNPPA